MRGGRDQDKEEREAGRKIKKTKTKKERTKDRVTRKNETHTKKAGRQEEKGQERDKD